MGKIILVFGLSKVKFVDRIGVEKFKNFFDIFLVFR